MIILKYNKFFESRSFSRSRVVGRAGFRSRCRTRTGDRNWSRSSSIFGSWSWSWSWPKSCSRPKSWSRSCSRGGWMIILKANELTGPRSRSFSRLWATSISRSVSWPAFRSRCRAKSGDWARSYSKSRKDLWQLPFLSFSWLYTFAFAQGVYLGMDLL